MTWVFLDYEAFFLATWAFGCVMGLASVIRQIAGSRAEDERR